MAILSNSFEGGTNGGTISAANSGGVSGDAFDSVLVNAGGGTIQYSTTSPYLGPTGMRIRTDAGGPIGSRWETSLATPSDYYVSFGLRFDVVPAIGSVFILTVRSSTNTFNGGVLLGFDGKIYVYNASIASVGNSTAALSANTWYRIEAHVFNSLTVGYITVRIYPSATSTSITETVNATPTTWAMTQATTSKLTLGAESAPTQWPSVTAGQYCYFDSWRAGKTTDWYGPENVWYTNTVPPIVSGALTVGGTLTCTNGTWNPTPSSFNHYWHREDDALGTNLVEIGATGSTYTLAAADVGKFIRAGVIPVQ